MYCPVTLCHMCSHLKTPVVEMRQIQPHCARKAPMPRGRRCCRPEAGSCTCVRCPRFDRLSRVASRQSSIICFLSMLRACLVETLGCTAVASGVIVPARAVRKASTTVPLSMCTARAFVPSPENLDPSVSCSTCVPYSMKAAG